MIKQIKIKAFLVEHLGTEKTTTRHCKTANTLFAWLRI